VCVPFVAAALRIISNYLVLSFADSVNREDAAVGTDADLDVMGHPTQKSGGEGAAADPRSGMSELDRAVDEAVSSSIATPGCLLDAEGVCVCVCVCAHSVAVQYSFIISVVDGLAGSVLIAPPAFWEDPSQAGPVMSRKTPKGGSSAPTGASGGGPSKSMTSSSAAAGVSVGVTQSAARGQPAPASRKSARA
jgi:hypothetical protein